MAAIDAFLFHAREIISGAIPMMAAAVHCLADNVWYCCIFIYCTLSIWGLFKVIFFNLRS